MTNPARNLDRSHCLDLEFVAPFPLIPVASTRSGAHFETGRIPFPARAAFLAGSPVSAWRFDGCFAFDT